ncbi:MAG: prepilin peptidase [Coriobacteriales bacterium]|jgi:leader peptidase (prepilin peptidase)/N-methyltransferase|nr:prepilin peptidase [Coriobacteriales bacterium]
MLAATALLLGLVFCLGAAVGSFLNVLVYRLPLRLGFVVGTSQCPSCGHRLAAHDLIPVISYILLRGRCRYCGRPISLRYPFVELLGGLSAVVSYCAFLPPAGFLLGPDASAAIFAFAPGFTVLNVSGALTCFLVLCILIAVTFIDLDTQEIPDALNVCLLVCGLASFALLPGVAMSSHLLGLVCVSVPMGVLAFALPGSFGFGDVKLVAAGGLLLGWEFVVLAAFIGVVIGGLQGVFLLVFGKRGRKEHFAFGPALCIGIAAALLAGGPILSTYWGFF